MYLVILMLVDFFRGSTDRKQRVNKEQNFEIDSAASSGDRGNLPLASTVGSTVDYKR